MNAWPTKWLKGGLLKRLLHLFATESWQNARNRFGLKQYLSQLPLKIGKRMREENQCRLQPSIPPWLEQNWLLQICLWILKPVSKTFEFLLHAFFQHWNKTYGRIYLRKLLASKKLFDFAPSKKETILVSLQKNTVLYRLTFSLFRQSDNLPNSIDHVRGGCVRVCLCQAWTCERTCWNRYKGFISK